MSIQEEARHKKLAHITRRHFLRNCSTGLGAVALSSLAGCGLSGVTDVSEDAVINAGLPHFAARAKHVIFLHMAGGPSQHELFDYKPTLARLHGQECPPSLLEGKRFALSRASPKCLARRHRSASTGFRGMGI